MTSIAPNRVGGPHPKNIEAVRRLRRSTRCRIFPEDALSDFLM
jgi:hypothetical protein